MSRPNSNCPSTAGIRFDVLTLFPDMFAPVLHESMIGRAVRGGIIGLNIIDIREFSADKHKKTDDYPYGGGTGMVMTAQPIYDAWRSVVYGDGASGGAGNGGSDSSCSACASGGGASSCSAGGSDSGDSGGAGDGAFKSRVARTLYMSPQGAPLTQKKAIELSREKRLVILCGHYEGVDERVLEAIVDEEISIGDYVLTGGEIPAMALIDAVSRLVPGVLPDAEAYTCESHYSGLLEYPQYTRPARFMQMGVPDVLLNGNHSDIERWRRDAALERTRRKRPDMFAARPRRIPLDGADNVRDLGGYPAANGGVTRWGVFYRSDWLNGVTPADKARLLGLGIDTVIDLRSRAEADDYPDALSPGNDVNYHNQPLLSDAAIEKAIANAPFRELYILFAERGIKKIGKVFRIMANSRGACLFHCYAGKDRTGIVAALLLLLAGVSIADVIADYEVSGTYYRHKWDNFERGIIETEQEYAISPPANIEYLMNHIFRKYGGAEAYLRAAGVTAGDIAALRGKFISAV